MDKKEATLVGFRLLFSNERKLSVELTTNPYKDLAVLFDGHPDGPRILAAVSKANAIIQNAQAVIQEEINS